MEARPKEARIYGRPSEDVRRIVRSCPEHAIHGRTVRSTPKHATGPSNRVGRRTTWLHRLKYATGPSNRFEVDFRLEKWTHARRHWRMNADVQWWYNEVQRTLEFTSGGSSHFLRTFQGSRSTFGRWWMDPMEPTEPTEPTELTELWSSLPTGGCRS